jgi:hypothetical protein
MSGDRTHSPHPRRRHDVLAIVLSVLMAFLSLTKAWLFFLMGPALLVAIPLLFVVRSRVEQLRVLGRLTPEASRLATAQLIGLLVAYVCVPGYGDTSEVLLFAFLWVKLANPLVAVMWYTGIAGAVLAMVSTIAFNGVWRRSKAS